METMYIYECNSAMCRGKIYGTVEQPLSCPYCDATAIEDDPISYAVITRTKKED